jgi:hypothetical protein
MIVWALPPVVLAGVVRRLDRPARPLQARVGANTDLETLGWFGLAGLGWISSGRAAIGVPVLVVRLLMLGAGVVFLPLFGLAAADSCADGGDSCVSLQLGVLFDFVFLLALWLAFPVASATLLRRANDPASAGARPALPRALLWIGAGLLALYGLPMLLRLALRS